MGCLIKRICQLPDNPFIMLPQTYGPFKSITAKKLASKILKHADKIYSRDKSSLEVIESLIGKTRKSIVCPDVAFTLRPASRETVAQKCNKTNCLIDRIDDFKNRKYHIIGLNISGLLFFCDYTRNNEFGLCDNYPLLINRIITFFLSQNDTFVMLVPHVVPENLKIENDLMACRKVWNTLPEDFKERTLIIETNHKQLFFDQCEIKYLIGLCDFFLGSRMHATIASISQCIPTIGLAYSKKFSGVYQTAGIEYCVVDLRKDRNEKILDSINTLFNENDVIRAKLRNSIPQVKQQVFSILGEL
jgi:polysaccharide pyruvyl transferase WcaK-like protein